MVGVPTNEDEVGLRRLAEQLRWTRLSRPLIMNC
jgi:hypothetical protein